MTPKKQTKNSPSSATKSTKPAQAVTGFSAEERAAAKERVEELKAEARRGPRANKADGEADVLAKIAEMPESDRIMAERIHAIVKANASTLSPKTWYGMPAYARDGNVVCFFQSATQVQSEIRDLRLHRQSKPRRRIHVALRLCAEEANRCRRSKNRRAREKSGELIRSLHR